MTAEELHELAEEALDDLRRRARQGEADARRALLELGEVPPPPRPWSDTDDDDPPRGAA